MEYKIVSDHNFVFVQNKVNDLAAAGYTVDRWEVVPVNSTVTHIMYTAFMSRPTAKKATPEGHFATPLL